jgi:hypothetical protein
MTMHFAKKNPKLRFAAAASQVTGKHIRIRTTDSRWHSLTIEELPSKPLKRRVRMLRVENSNGHRDANPDLAWRYNPWELIDNAGLSTRMTYDQAKTALETYFARLYDEFAAKGLPSYELKAITYSLKETDVSYLEIEPLDYKSLTLKGKDFTLYAEWNNFSVRRFAEEAQSEELSHGGDPHYSYVSSSSPTAARAVFNSVKADPTLVTGKSYDEFRKWMDERKIKVKYNNSYW